MPAKKQLIDAVELSFSPPSNMTAEDAVLFKKDTQKSLPAVYMHTLEDINLTKEGILSKNFSVCTQFLIWPEHKKTYNTFYLLRNLVSAKKITLPENNAYAVCFDYWSHGYFHWICDFLPRLYLLHEEINNITLLLPQQYSASFFADSLKPFTLKNIYKIPGNAYVHCPALHIADRIAPSGEHNPHVIKKVRDKLIGYYKNDFENIPYAEKIYVSRAKCAYRKVTNEEEVTAFLVRQGFHVIYFEDYSLSQQIAISHHAKYMVSLHGAGLTNLLFMKANSRVLEFRKNSPDHVNCYFSLASSVGIGYYYQLCEYRDNLQTGGNAFDVTVDLKRLQANIELMICS